eukprot:349984-Chlamydomonas_euryale.AAC.7
MHGGIRSRHLDNGACGGEEATQRPAESRGTHHSLSALLRRPQRALHDAVHNLFHPGLLPSCSSQFAASKAARASHAKSSNCCVSTPQAGRCEGAADWR